MEIQGLICYQATGVRATGPVCNGPGVQQDAKWKVAVLTSATCPQSSAAKDWLWATNKKTRHCINLHLNKHFCGTFELFTGKVLYRVIGLIVLFCFTECGWGNNGYGWITSTRQLRRTTTNWKTEDFSLACGGIAGSNQIPRKGAQPCAALFQKWVIPGIFQVAEMSWHSKKDL